MNYNSFKLAGRYIHKYKDNENHYIILIALMYPINKKEPTELASKYNFSIEQNQHL